jgi:hypothetical protein
VSSGRNTSTGCAPDTASRRSTTKNGTPVTPSADASASSARTAPAPSSVASAASTAERSSPASAATSASTSTSSTTRPCSKCALISRSIRSPIVARASGPSPSREAAMCTSRCASKVFAGTTVSKSYARPTPAATSVTWANIRSTCSTGIPFIRDSSSRSVMPGCAEDGSASGWSSKDRQVTSTLSRCGNSARAAANRRLPM